MSRHALDPQRREARDAYWRILMTGLAIFLPIATLMRFALPRDSHGFMFLGIGYGTSAGIAMSWWREPPMRVAWRMALVQLTVAIFVVAMAWTVGI